MGRGNKRRLSPGVGYIGSGNKSSVFTRKSKVAFEEIKYIYGEELERFNSISKKTKLSFIELSEDEKVEIRNRIKLKIQKEQNIDRLKSVIAFLFTIGLFYLIWTFIIN